MSLIALIKPKAVDRYVANGELIPAYEFHRIFDYINKKYNLNIWDYEPAHKAFKQWLVANEIPLAGLDENQTRMLYQQFNAAIGSQALPEQTTNFAHWLAGQYVIKTGAVFTIDIARHLNTELRSSFYQVICALMREFGHTVNVFVGTTLVDTSPKVYGPFEYVPKHLYPPRI